MDFFKRIKTKLKFKNFVRMIFCSVAAVTAFILALSNGFSSETDWEIAHLIPLPNWLVSSALILFAAFLALSSIYSLISLIKDTEYNKIIHTAENIGNLEAIGSMLSSISKTKYTKGGDLRFNNKILFYMKDTDVTLISAIDIRGIKVQPSKNNKTVFICIYHNNDILNIEAKKEKALPLLDELRGTYNVYR